MAYERGEIYFVRESLDGTHSNHSPYVKIGLIRFNEDDRDSFGRLREHQTGNPRKLFINKEDIVETDAVDRVEALLHRIYSSKRISGEWFELKTEAEIQEAVEKAKSLSAEVASIVPKFQQAEALKTVISNGEIKEKTESDIEFAKVLASAKCKLKVVSDIQDDINNLLTVVREAGGDVEAVAKTIVRTFSPKFDETKFKEDNPEIWSEYAVEITSLASPKFLEKLKYKFEDLDSGFVEEINSIKAQVQAAVETKDVTLLNEPILQLNNIEGLAKWDVEVAQAELKISVGEYDGIEDVCSWKRKETTTVKLNSGLLMAEHEDLYKKYIFTPDPKEYVITKKKKA